MCVSSEFRSFVSEWVVTGNLLWRSFGSGFFSLTHNIPSFIRSLAPKFNFFFFFSENEGRAREKERARAREREQEWALQQYNFVCVCAMRMYVLYVAVPALSIRLNVTYLFSVAQQQEREGTNWRAREPSRWLKHFNLIVYSLSRVNVFARIHVHRTIKCALAAVGVSVSVWISVFLHAHSFCVDFWFVIFTLTIIKLRIYHTPIRFFTLVSWASMDKYNMHGRR